MKRQHISALSLVLFGAVCASAQITLNPVAERAVGTPGLTVENAPQSPNLVEGREFYAPESVALDTSVSPPILYVSDYVNNRVLAWKNAASFTSGQIADLAIGQPDLRTTFPAGPNAVSQKVSSFTSGLFRPSGIAVDQNGNLYVVDGGDNRVLRYPKPFAQTSQFPEPDTWIGQASVNGFVPNYPNGTSTPTAQGLLFNAGSGTILNSSIAFDSAGNLWVIDTGNSRVLRFNASSLSVGGGTQTADIVLGQQSFTTLYPALNVNTYTNYYNVSQFVVTPSALGFDQSGNLYVGDANRVLVFTPPFSTGMSASSKILGIFPAGYAFPTAQTAEQMLLDQTTVLAPTGIVFPAGAVAVVDSGYNRIMIYPSFANWPTGAPPSANTILGQPNACTQSQNQTCKFSNNGNAQPNNSVFNGPGGAVLTSTDLYLADTGNNRVLDLPVQGATFSPATRVLGQYLFNTNSPDLIEGREFNFTGLIGNNAYSDAGMAIDNSSGTPHLYVADPYNNRVLGFKDVRTFQNNGPKADIVLGQFDFTTALINYPSGNPSTPSQSSLYRPTGVLVDANGNLYVADSLNGRVLRFPKPFSYSGTGPEPADLVLGQSSFTATIADPTNTNMAIPYGLAFTPSCNTASQACAAPNGLVVTDQAFNRVLYFPTTNGSFVAGTDNGKAATVVFGQTSFSGYGSGSSLASLNSPHHIACDTNGYVYVADSGNNRIVIYPDPHGAGTATAGEQASAQIANLSTPQGVYVSPVTGEIWVANTGAGDVLRFQNYQDVLLGQGSISGIVDASGNFGFSPLAAVQDQYGDLFIADTAHRVGLYFPGVNLCNAASFLPTSVTSGQYPSSNCLPLYDSSLKTAGVVLPSRPLAPGVIATLFPCDNCAGTQFLTGQNVFPNYPVPTKLGDVEVLVSWQNGLTTTTAPAPLYIVYPGQINFIMPNEAPSSGTVDLEVVQVSTGQILGANGLVPMYSVAPGIFPYPGGQSGPAVYAAALNINADGSETINSASNPASPGQAMSMYMTGQGAVPGVQDGVPATAAQSAQYGVTVLLNGIDVNDPNYQESSIQHVLYSGINQYPGMWQVNFLIPKTVVPTNGAVWFDVIMQGLAATDATSPFKTYIYVK